MGKYQPGQNAANAPLKKTDKRSKPKKAPPLGLRFMQVTALCFGLVLLLGFLTSLVLYGFVVSYESSINHVRRLAAERHEENKTLQVELNRSQSFQRIESAASTLTHLVDPEEIVNVDARYQRVRFEEPREPAATLPVVQGL